jgi:hypothetical protein
MGEKIYLGLDISTQTIGTALYKHKPEDVNTSGEIIIMRGLSLKNKYTNKLKGMEALLEKKNIFQTELMNLVYIAEKGEKKKIDKVVIEEALISSNNAVTVSTLLKFNGIISAIVYDMLGIVPEYISSYESRCYAFPHLMEAHVYDKKGNKRDRKEVIKAVSKDNLVLFGGYPFGIDKKTVIQQEISDIFPNIQWLYNKDNELVKENFDATDALAVILASINKEKYNGEKPTVVDSEPSEDGIKYTTRMGDLTYTHNVKFNKN